MKKIVLLIVGIYCISNFSFAQEEEKTKGSDEKMSKQVEVITTQITSIQKEQKNTKNEIETIKSKIDKNYKIDAQKSENQVKDWTKIILNTTDFVKAAYRSFKSVEVSLEQADVMNEITKINNPTNDELGFSIKSVIKSLYGKYLKKGIGEDNEKVEKVNSYVDNILNNPIVSAVKSIVPAVNTVVSFISNLSFGSKKVSKEQLQDFLKELNKYMVVYDGLGVATQNFENQITQIHIKATALEMILQSYVIDRVTDLKNPKATAPERTKDKLDTLISTQFTNEIVAEKIRKIQERNIGNGLADIVDARLKPKLTAISQARYIQDELETLYNQYLSIHENYLKEIAEILTKSKELENANKVTIDKKIVQLSEKHKNWAEKFEKLVDVTDLKTQVRMLEQSNL